MWIHSAARERETADRRAAASDLITASAIPACDSLMTVLRSTHTHQKTLLLEHRRLGREQRGQRWRNRSQEDKETCPRSCHTPPHSLSPLRRLCPNLTLPLSSTGTQSLLFHQQPHAALPASLFAPLISGRGSCAEGPGGERLGKTLLESVTA